MIYYTSLPTSVVASQYLGLIRKAYTTPGVPLYCTYDDGYSLGDTLTVNVTTKSFYIVRNIRAAVFALGGKCSAITAECAWFADDDRTEMPYSRSGLS